MNSVGDLESAKEIILREAEYVLAVLSEDKEFLDDLVKICRRLRGKMLDANSVRLLVAR